MKKNRLLLMALASMLAIGGYAQTEDEWVAKAKANLLGQYPTLGEQIYTSPTFVYCFAFSYTEGNSDKQPIHEDMTIKLDRDKGLAFYVDYAAFMKDDKSITEDQRPELNYKLTGSLKNSYDNLILVGYHDQVRDWYAQLKENHTDVRMKDSKDIHDVRGGKYFIHANPGTESQIYDPKIIVNADAECRVDFLNDLNIVTPLVIGSTVHATATIASGYPYTVSDYQGKTMQFSAFDADGKQIFFKNDIKLEATANRSEVEYVIQERFLLPVTSTKYTFKFSGGPLTKELVITKEVQPDLNELKVAIDNATIICDAIMNDPDPDKVSLYADKVEALRKQTEKAKEYLKMKVDKQAAINDAANGLMLAVRDLSQVAGKQIATVSTAQELIDAITKDPYSAPTIKLTGDIDLSEVENQITNSFGGIIDGSNPSQPEKPYALIGAKSHLFGMINNARFTNLTFRGSIIQDNNDNLGVISREAYNSKFENIRMESISVQCQGSNAGTIAGSATNCEFNHIYLTGTTYSITVFANGSNAGGLVGVSESCKFNDCHIDKTIPVYANTSCGGFSGKSTKDSFEQCETLGLVGASQKYLGGIAGQSKDSKFVYCVNKGVVLPGTKRDLEKCYIGMVEFASTSIDCTGGICGSAENGSVEQCSNYSKIYGKAGGILGSATKVEINNCLNTSDSGSSFAGIANQDDNSKIINCVSTVDCPLVANGKNTNSKSANNYSFRDRESTRTQASYEMCVDRLDLESGHVARWLNNGLENRAAGIEPWRQSLSDVKKADRYPVLDPSHEAVTLEVLTYDRGFQIGSAKRLLEFAELVNNGDQFGRACLTADIDMSEIDAFWVPIGKDEPGKHFRGIFDGRGHTIKGLKCSSQDAVGLFGAVHANAEILNVIVEDSEFTNVIDGDKGTGGDKGAGGIVGKVNIGWTWGTVFIENCGSYADINVVQHGGGILGRVDANNDNNVKVIINNCWSMGTVTAQKGNDNNGNSGLLCGYTKNHAVVRDCWSGGQLKVASGYTNAPYSAVNPKNEGEFLVGYDKTLDIKDCYIYDPAFRVDHCNDHQLQEGVTIISDDAASSGELAYRLNKGVTDGTQTWYQQIGKDLAPVRIKLTDGTNIVYGIADSEGNIIRYANTSHEEITQVILGIESIEAHPVTDINKSGDVDVTDLTEFTEAANR